MLLAMLLYWFQILCIGASIGNFQDTCLGLHVCCKVNFANSQCHDLGNIYLKVKFSYISQLTPGF